MDYAWSNLRHFHHVPSTADRIVNLHSLTAKQRENARKQATQIRQCLLQAKEYRDAAQSTTLATRPVLLYYSIMSLALAQVLYKGTGSDSLDKARGEHAHHGLQFQASNIPKDKYDLTATARTLTARPMIVDRRRRGTFELWHRTAREDPITGRYDQPSGEGSHYTPNRVFFSASDSRLGELSSEGISFLDCLQGAPGMEANLARFGVRTKITKAELNAALDKKDTESLQLLVQPQSPEILHGVMNDIIMRPDAINSFQITEFQSGFHLYCKYKQNEPSIISVPRGSMWNEKEIRFLPPGSVLNEFGYIYIGLYILGNFARYYPDRWIGDVENGTPLALAAEQFVEMADYRMALLTLSELSRIYYIRSR